LFHHHRRVMVDYGRVRLMMTSYLESDIAKCLASRVSTKSMLVLNARVGNLHSSTRFALHSNPVRSRPRDSSLSDKKGFFTVGRL
jgi:hypothetical protein